MAEPPTRTCTNKNFEHLSLMSIVSPQLLTSRCLTRQPLALQAGSAPQVQVSADLIVLIYLPSLSLESERVLLKRDYIENEIEYGDHNIRGFI